ncbi:unnamed protein product [Macrosiphum euphorbiae]|uniref:MULE transposase domain-containing protein n=1 Tax=Macrosiphum euphorbiae TaxID=13131 RepID=A0AAV0VR55_9HEMI|nr:unnamed protein product [Macrosiphum euphorbiae]
MNIDILNSIHGGVVLRTSQTINSHVSKEAARQIIKRQRRNEDIYLEPQTADIIDLPLYLRETLSGAINALNDMFPLATHSACFFHLSQNIFKKLQSLGLSSMYSNDPEFNLLAKQIPALAFLPANMIVDGWTLLKPLFKTEEEQQLSQYFEETYVLGKSGMRLRGRPTKQTIRNPPMFPPEMWSVADRLNLGLPRTTNVAESWHRKINRLVSPNPSLFKFIKLIQKVQNETESTVEQLIQGRISKRAKKNVDVQNARLKCIQQRIYDDDKLDKLEFLKGIAHNLTL